MFVFLLTDNVSDMMERDQYLNLFLGANTSFYPPYFDDEAMSKPYRASIGEDY